MYKSWFYSLAPVAWLSYTYFGLLYGTLFFRILQQSCQTKHDTLRGLELSQYFSRNYQREFNGGFSSPKDL